MEAKFLNTYSDTGNRFKKMNLHRGVFPLKSAETSREKTYRKSDLTNYSLLNDKNTEEDYNRTLEDWQSHMESFPLSDNEDEQLSREIFNVGSSFRNYAQECEEVEVTNELEYEGNSDSEASNSSDEYDDDADYEDNGCEEGPVIHVFTVDPDLDLCSSSDEDESIEIYNAGNRSINSIEDPYKIELEALQNTHNKSHDDMSHQVEFVRNELNLTDSDDDSNISENEKDQILYSNQKNERKPIYTTSENEEDFCSTNNCNNNTNPVNESIAKVSIPYENFDSSDDMLVKVEKEKRDCLDTTETSINNETKVGDYNNVEALPNLAVLKKYLFDESPESKNVGKFSSSKVFQKSFSLPQSPFHHSFPLFDPNEEKTSLSLEDLNVSDLHELNFDVDNLSSLIDVSTNDNVNPEGEFDYKSFLITDAQSAFKGEDFNVVHENEKGKENVEITLQSEIKNPGNIVEDNLLEEEMDLEDTLVPKIDCSLGEISAESNVQDNELANSPQMNVLDFCIEKPKMLNEVSNIKLEQEDFIDIETCPENTPVPVLEANNLKSLLEQFEASEKFNNVSPSKQSSSIQEMSSLQKSNGTRLQDAAAQLNKNKMKQILIPPIPNIANDNVQSDHDYCSPVKNKMTRETNSSKNYSFKAKNIFEEPNSKRNSNGRANSLLKPGIIEKNNKDSISKIESKGLSKYCKVNQHVTETDHNYSGIQNSDDRRITRGISRVIEKNTGINKNSILKDNFSSLNNTDGDERNSNNGPIKLTIKNKSKVILNTELVSNKLKRNKSEKPNDRIMKINNKKSKKCNQQSLLKPMNINNDSFLTPFNAVNKKLNTCESIQNENRPKNLTCMRKLDTPNAPQSIKPIIVRKPEITNELAVTIIQPLLNHETLENPIESEIKLETADSTHENPIESTHSKILPKKKLNLQEYKLRREANSCNNSGAASPVSTAGSSNSSPFANGQRFESITPLVDKQLPKPLQFSDMIQTNLENKSEFKPEKITIETKKIFDPITEARKILLNTKQQKAAALRKLEDDIVMRKIPKVENLELPPLTTDVEMLKLADIKSERKTKNVDPISPLQSKQYSEYEEIVMVSVGVNTKFEDVKSKDSKMKDSRSIPDVNFSIKTKEKLMQRNVFDIKTNLKISEEECNENMNNVKKLKTHSPSKDISSKSQSISYQELVADSLKKVGKSTDNKLLDSNSLLASIQNVVMKKTSPKNEFEDKSTCKKDAYDSRKKITSNRSKCNLKSIKIVKKEDRKVVHGEDKVILHLRKDRAKFIGVHVSTQTDSNPINSPCGDKEQIKSSDPNNAQNTNKTSELKDLVSVTPMARKRNDSDMSMSSDCSKNSESVRGSSKIPDSNNQSLVNSRHTDHNNSEKTKRSDKSKVRGQSKVKSRSIDRDISPRRSRDRYHSSHSRARSNTRRRNDIKRSPSRRFYSRTDRRSPASRRDTQRRYGRSRDRNDNSQRRRSISRIRSRRSYSRNRNVSSSRRRRDSKRPRSYSRRSVSRSRRSVSRCRHRYTKRSKSRNRTRDRSESQKTCSQPKKEARKSRSPSTKRTKLNSESKDNADTPKKNVEEKVEDSLNMCNDDGDIINPFGGDKFEPYTRNLGDEFHILPRCASVTSGYTSSSASSSSDSSSDSSSEYSTSSDESSGGRSATPTARRSRDRPGARVASPNFYRKPPDSGLGSNHRSSSEEGDIPSPVEDRRIVFVGRLDRETDRTQLRSLFGRFGPITDINLHTKDNGGRYGFVTFRHASDAWRAVEQARAAGPALQRFHVGFGGRRAFCRQRYADLDDIESPYCDNVDYIQPMGPMPSLMHKYDDELPFEVLLQETKKLAEQKKKLEVFSKRAEEKVDVGTKTAEAPTKNAEAATKTVDATDKTLEAEKKPDEAGNKKRKLDGEVEKTEVKVNIKDRIEKLRKAEKRGSLTTV